MLIEGTNKQQQQLVAVAHSVEFVSFWAKLKERTVERTVVE